MVDAVKTSDIVQRTIEGIQQGIKPGPVFIGQCMRIIIGIGNRRLATSDGQHAGHQQEDKEFL
jgi:hypothetical protein